MPKKLFLLIGISVALLATTFAQTNSTLNPVAVSSTIGGGRLDDEGRPRRAAERASGVKSSVITNTSSVERAAFDLLNQKRIEKGLKPLSWSDKVASVARLHSQNMAEFAFFSHRGLDGKLVSDRADSLGLGVWDAIGENIAFNRGFDDPIAKAVELWLGSPTHYHNLMDANWHDSAVGVAIAADGSYYFTQVFLSK